MGTFATFSEQERGQRTALRVQRDGSTMLLVTEGHGQIVASVDRQIDPQRAAELVDAVAVAVPEMVDGHGPCSIGFGRGEGQGASWCFDPDFAPSSLLWARSRFRNLADELAASERPRVQPAGEPQRSSASFTTMLLWSAGYFVANFVTGILGVIVGLVLMLVLGDLVGLVLALLVILGLSALSFFLIGRMQGRRYGDGAIVWQCAAMSVLLPALVVALSGGGVGALGSFLLPLAAQMGASTVAPPQHMMEDDFIGEETGRFEGPRPQWG